MDTMKISTDLWEAHVPEGWVHVEHESEGTVYFEAPDGAAGVYVTTWGVNGEPLRDVMDAAREIEQSNLPESKGAWAVVGHTHDENGEQIEMLTEYLNRTDGYRIVSRLLGRNDFYVRFTFHDYGCDDVAVSAERSDPVVRSLMLRSG